MMSQTEQRNAKADTTAANHPGRACARKETCDSTSYDNSVGRRDNRRQDHFLTSREQVGSIGGSSRTDPPDEQKQQTNKKSVPAKLFDVSGTHHHFPAGTCNTSLPHAGARPAWRQEI